MNTHLEHFLGTVNASVRAKKEEKIDAEVIKVSETVSVAATAYETVRNSLEYDEEHLLRRNAIRRILKRRLGDGLSKTLGGDLLRELIWARYLPNEEVPESMEQTVSDILEKYFVLFDQIEQGAKDDQDQYNWLLDLVSTEIEYTLIPPVVDEALASYAYQELQAHLKWSSKLIPEKDRDLQLYIAVHRTVLKSNIATLRFRILTLYYPEWTKAKASNPVVQEIAGDLDTVIESVHAQLVHQGADSMYRLIRKHAIVFHVLRDIMVDDPDAFFSALEVQDTDLLAKAITKATEARYDRFGARLRRAVVRAVFFLFLTKMFLAIVIELPYEQLILHETNYAPLFTNIIFHPLLLAVIGMTVRIPKKRNTAKIIQEIEALLGLGGDFSVVYKVKRPWSSGAIRNVFNALYALMFLVVIGLISTGLAIINFNVLSIFFFIFFLSLVTFFGLKIRNTKRELVIVESKANVIGTLVDIVFLPIIRAGRWMSLRAPRINIFLFFFDFIIEAPFKAAIKMIEGWLAFLREKKEEI